jgi:hypothetical protein
MRFQRCSLVRARCVSKISSSRLKRRTCLRSLKSLSTPLGAIQQTEPGWTTLNPSPTPVSQRKKHRSTPTAFRTSSRSRALLLTRETEQCILTLITIQRIKYSCNGLKRRTRDVNSITMKLMKKHSSTCSTNCFRTLKRTIGFTTSNRTLNTHLKKRLSATNLRIWMPCHTKWLATRGLSKRAVNTTLSLRTQNLTTSGSKTSCSRIVSSTRLMGGSLRRSSSKISRTMNYALNRRRTSSTWMTSCSCRNNSPFKKIWKN